jgi:hypothetical protein
VLDDLGTEKIAMLNETIFSQSDNGKNYLVADIAAAFEGQNAKLTNISSLDIHPNADGHALIAETLEPLIEEQTYTYYDKNAAKKYKSEHGDESDEEDDDEESEEGNMKVVYLALGAAVVITAASAITVITVIRKNKKTKPAK